MNYRNITTVAALAAALALGGIAKADPIVGGINFGSIPPFDQPGAALSQVTSDTYDLSLLNAYITGTNGSTFASVPVPSSAASVDLSFATILLTGTNPNFTSAALTSPTDNGGDLWQFTSGGTLYTFVPTTFIVTVANQGGFAWLITGTGVFTATGYDDTPGTYSLDFSANGDSTGFASTQEVGVPDSGTTALLLGLGMLAMGAYAFRSKLSKV